MSFLLFATILMVLGFLVGMLVGHFFQKSEMIYYSGFATVFSGFLGLLVVGAASLIIGLPFTIRNCESYTVTEIGGCDRGGNCAVRGGNQRGVLTMPVKGDTFTVCSTPEWK